MVPIDYQLWQERERENENVSERNEQKKAKNKLFVPQRKNISIKNLI